MISKTQLRDYEVSIWTLQDSFITVLKNSNLERRGEIEEPQMTLKDDGENSLSFKIPMYIVNENGEYVENPIWYNTINGTIMASLRKIKVIFNKNTDDEKVFEFIITSVTESHEGYKKYCSISCEGLAFHELGKQGYKIALEGADEIDIAYKKWIETQEGTEPLPTLNYWANRVFANSNWSYEVRMDWSAYGGNRNDSKKVYEETEDIEKCRLIEAKESNRYNLSQTIAETFQVFCRYEYTYDENYHIVGRKAIYYNNFIKETDGIIDLTYKFNTEQLTRTIDGTDLVTKMFVSPLKDNDSSSGEVNISNTEYNEGLEDYILNFDYLYNIGSISQEQYNAIPNFLSAIKIKNQVLIQKSEQKIELENERIEQEARLKIAQYKSEQALENISQYSAIKDSITGGNGSVELNDATSRLLTLIKDGNSYYANLHEKGIDKSSIKIYKTKNNDTLENQINQFVVENDEYGNPYRVKYIPASVVPEEDEPGKYSAYIIYNYNPKIGYENVIHEYEKVKAKNDEIANDAQNKLGDSTTSGIYKNIADIEKREQTLIQKKQELISEFEHLMGPALREGTWKPEDEYAGYGDNYINSFNSIGTSFDNNTVSLAWDEELFDDEQDIYYYYGPSLEKRYYPIIKLTGNFSNWLNEKFTFIYKLPNTTTNNMSDKGYMALGSKMLFRYVKMDNTVYPCLILLDAILLDAEKVSESELTNISATGYLATVTVNSSGAYVETNRIINANLEWIIAPNAITNSNSNIKVVYPRFKFNSNKLKSPNTAIIIKNNANILENYEDYYVLNRDGFWYATLKPEVIAQYGKNYDISYTLSTAAKAIYFDAVQILKENSCPKVSYEIELMSLNKEFTHTAYDKLGQIAHINDFELKFENTMGYISEVNLDLDQPWQDKVVIKNYKTKFEDLFSTIVAQTEQMKKNSYIFGMVSDAFNNGKLSDELIDDIYNRLPTQLEHIISPAEIYAQYEPIIRQQLKTSWEEAGKILAAAVSSVNDVNDVVLESGNILAGFKEDIAAKLTPSSFIDNNSKERTSTKTGISARDFKVGDVWVHNNNTYIATENSKQLYPNGYPSDILTSLNGWTLTQNGRLAGITGTVIDIDTKAGNISLKAMNKIEVLAKTQLDLAANDDVFITGNNSVNIGSKWVNIAGTNGGINIITSDIGINTTKNNDGTVSGTSALKLNKNGIIIASSAEVTIKSAKGINIYTSDNSTTSAIRINREEGIYLGSNKPLILYSGNLPESGTNGAAVELTAERILFGVSDTSNSGTAVDLTKDRIIFGAGNVVNGNNKENIGESGSNGVAGVKITKSAIKMAAGNNVRSYLSLTNSEVKIANATQEGNGASVTINQEGVIIGTANNININENASSGNPKMTFTAANSSTTARFQVYSPRFVVDANGHLYAYDADIGGRIRASSGQIGGWTIESNILYYNSNTPSNNSFILSPIGVSSSTSIGGSSGSKIWMLTGKNKFGVTTAGDLYATEATISGAITATSLAVGSGDNTLTYNNNTLTVTGTINAKAGNIGGCSIDANGLHVDAAHISSVNASAINAGTINAAISLSAATITGGSISIGSGFSVGSTGHMICNGAEINGSGTFNGSLSITGSSFIGSTLTINDGGGIYFGEKADPESADFGACLNKDGFGITLGTTNNYSEFTITSDRIEFNKVKNEIVSGSIKFEKDGATNTFNLYSGKNIEIEANNELTLSSTNTWLFADSSEGAIRLEGYKINLNGITYVNNKYFYAKTGVGGTKYRIYVSSYAPTDDNLDGIFTDGVERVLWINTNGNWTDLVNQTKLQRIECSVYWYKKKDPLT